jgi:AN1-like Zinc finger
MSSSKSGCAKCRRKTMMTIKCKCEKTFCFECRYPEDHECSFDFRADQKEKLRRDNPVVISEKLEKL